MFTRKKETSTPLVAPSDGSAPRETMPSDEYFDMVSSPHRFVPLSTAKLVGRRMYIETFFRALMDKGAVLSFFTLLTAIPTLMAFYAITTLVLDQNRDTVMEITDDFIEENVPSTFAEQAQQIIETIIGSTEQSVITLVISVVIALFSSSAYMRAFSRASNGLYGRLEGRTIVKTWLTMWGLTIVIVFGLVLIAAGFFLRDDILEPFLENIAAPLGLDGVTQFLLDQVLPVWGFLRWPVIFILSAMLIALLFHVGPNVKYGKFRWLTTGSVLALVGISLVGLGVRVYLNNFLHIGMYGALGGLIGGFLGLVLANTILLFGLKLDAEITRARELCAGLPSHDLIMVPPHSSEAANVIHDIDADLISKAEDFRSQHANEEA